MTPLKREKMTKKKGRTWCFGVRGFGGGVRL